MQNISVVGNVANPEKKTVNGKSVLNFSVAVNTKHKGEEKVTWYRVAVWEKQADSLAPYIHKGDKIAVSGELDVRVFDGKTYLEIPFARVTLCSSKPKSGEEATSSPSQSQDETPF